MCLRTVKDTIENVLFELENSLSMFEVIFSLIKELESPPQQEFGGQSSCRSKALQRRRPDKRPRMPSELVCTFHAVTHCHCVHTRHCDPVLNPQNKERTCQSHLWHLLDRHVAF